MPSRRHLRKRRLTIDLDVLFGSRLAGRALLLMRELGAADVAELADLLATRRPLVRRALRRFVELGIVEAMVRTGLRRRYRLSASFRGADALRKLLDAHRRANPTVRATAKLSVRCIDGPRGPRHGTCTPPGAKSQLRGLDQIPTALPFCPPNRAKVLAVLAAGPFTTADICRVLNWPLAEGLRVATKLAEIGLVETTRAPFERGVNRWYRLGPAAKPIRSYLRQTAGVYRIPKRRIPLPTTWNPSHPRASSWRAIATTEPPSAHVLEVLSAVKAGIGDEYAIARMIGMKAHKVRPILARLEQTHFIQRRIVGNEADYTLSAGTRGRALRALLGIGASVRVTKHSGG
jgi:DNA-binding MarR family transcriptional regulator